MNLNPHKYIFNSLDVTMFINFYRNFKNQVLAIAFLSDLIGVRFSLALGAILWGIMLWWPGETFDRPTYALMEKFAPELVWGSLFLVQGAYSMYDVMNPGIKNRTSMIFDAALGCVLWTLSCICMLLSVYPPPAAIAGEISLALASWWNLVRFNYKREI